jgi:hypothetical protein
MIESALMHNLPEGVRPALRFLSPARTPWLLSVAGIGSWLYVRLGNRVRHEELFGMDRLVGAYRQMQEGSIRLIVAFRHPGVEDGTMVFRLLSGIVAREARHLGVALRWAPRAHFLFGRDVPEWSGHFLEWLLPRIGGISVYPGRYDSESINTVRRYLTDMPHPLALAPEGQVVYHNERVSALESGTAQLAFWCIEDLKRQSRSEDVVILPVCTSYHYDPRDWRALLRILDRIETECGLPLLNGLTPPPRPSSPPGDEDREKIYIRVARATRRVLDLAEDFYARFYACRFAARTEDQSEAVLQKRVQDICEAALSVGERFFHLTPKGDFVRRVMALRMAGISWMYREDIPDLAALPAAERALADRIAVESWLSCRHMELVDALEYMRVDYLQPESDFDRFVEFITNLWDVVNRLKGGNVSGRINPLKKTARIIVNEPLQVSPRWSLYKENRRKAVDSLTHELHESFRRVAETGNRPVT